MITLTASGSSVIFNFDGNSTYLNNGTIEVPKNSLALIIDESDMATFRKAASNDIFVSANIAEFGMTKDELIAWYKANMVSSGGGGGGVTPEEVEEMINEAVSGKADSSDVYTTGQTSGATEIANALAEKLDATAYTPTDLSNYYTKDETSGKTEISNALAEKLAISDFNTYSGAVDTAINSKASQSTVDALSGVVTSHTSDSTIHLTSGDVQTQIDNSISGKANSSDVYLKSETSGATQLATAFAGKQDQLIAGENITISGNVISSEGGSCTVEEVIIYDRIIGTYYDSDGNNKITYAITDYIGDKTTSDSISMYFEIGDTSDSYGAWIYFDYVNHSANTDSLTDYVAVEYISDVQEFKVSVVSAYQSSYWIKSIQGLDSYKNVLIPYYTINSGSPCTVIETDVVGLITKVKDQAYGAIKSCNFVLQKDKMFLDIYHIDGRNDVFTIKLEELDGSNNTLKPDIQVPLGTSGWTEMTFNGSCSTNGNPKSPIIRMSGDTNLNAFNTQWEVNLEHYGTSYDSVTWNGSEFVLNSNWFGEYGEFGTATVTYDDVNNTLTIAYPLTAQVGGIYTDNVELKSIYNQNCQFGVAITKFEYYAEQTQPLKPYVQETKAALGGLSLVKLTKAEYDALSPNYDNNTLYVVIPNP